MQQKLHDDDDKNKNSASIDEEAEELRELYLTLGAKEARERAVGYGTYDAAQAREAEEKENAQQHPKSTASSRRWKHPIKHMKGYFKNKGSTAS